MHEWQDAKCGSPVSFGDTGKGKPDTGKPRESVLYPVSGIRYPVSYAAFLRSLRFTTAVSWSSSPMRQSMAAPKNTPVALIDRLNHEINAALSDPVMKAKFAEIGGEPLAGSPSEFGGLIAEETEKWGKVVKFTGLKPE